MYNIKDFKDLKKCDTPYYYQILMNQNPNRKTSLEFASSKSSFTEACKRNGFYVPDYGTCIDYLEGVRRGNIHVP